MYKRWEEAFTKNGGQVMNRNGCMSERQKWSWWKGSCISDVIPEM